MCVCVSNGERTEQVFKLWPVLIGNTISKTLLPGHCSQMPSWGTCGCDSHMAFTLIRAQSTNGRYCTPTPGRWQHSGSISCMPFLFLLIQQKSRYLSQTNKEKQSRSTNLDQNLGSLEQVRFLNIITHWQWSQSSPSLKIWGLHWSFYSKGHFFPL